MQLNKELYWLFNHPKTHKYGYVFQSLIFFNIFVSILTMFLLTEQRLLPYFDILVTINTINMIIFTLEYALRIYAQTYRGSVLKFIFTPYMLIDLIVIIPFYLTLFSFDFGFLRGLRVLRIFKLFRLARFSAFDHMVISIFKEKKEEFIFIFSALFTLLLIITPLVYYAETKAQPEVFTSMFTTFWWAVITFTTVGYGDMYPITAFGRILTVLISVLGIAFYAIPGSLFTSALFERINDRKEKKKNKSNKRNSQ